MQDLPPSLFDPKRFFFTLRLADPGSDLLLRRIGKLRSAMRSTLRHHGFRIDAIAVLPATIHMIWSLPPDDADIANRIGMLKARFSRHLPPATYRSPSQIKKGEKGIWQRGYWCHPLRGNADYVRHRGLIYYSPVEAGLCDTPQDWQYSSIHRDLARGYPLPPPLGPAVPQRQKTARVAL
ncbi:transposase [Sulfitobacter mediterraneus]|uniref:REP-associated tyrosine transposase n=1 Tax=Sulfitobacter mediterraneus TaxID=83219 RepID=UPI0019326CD8|nr:transposase [Sulfitobacter mediterraneus]MBM1309336.1 transposase [Sulfitobacter mediterraneus]MBM1313221.1 transposase [Sulfitobacter mediterraneus]MBM1321605.1 transposase [Sulfitobacter mediterraneus]MBM1325492.1 transposase [Sulfitobacter mediterraneus]MBM1396838.1 transposase [Sulfitobacter mediterraneus]